MMGQYNLSKEELKEEIKKLMLGLEGDFKLSDFRKATNEAYNELLTKRGIV